jgi:hypothetical protein
VSQLILLVTPHVIRARHGSGIAVMMSGN